MALLFAVAGISARYSLEKRSKRAFLKDRIHRILIPSIAGVFLLGWVVGWVTSKGPFFVLPAETTLPKPVIYLIYCLSGIGPLWFCHELFAGCLILLLLKTLDKKDVIWNLGGKVSLSILLPLGILVWCSAQLLNTPIVEVYRNGFYWFMFLLGYYVFSHEEVMVLLENAHRPLLIVGCIMGIAFTISHYGENYAGLGILKRPFTNAYAWIMVLGLLGVFKSQCNAPEGRFSQYMTTRNFGFYALHYPLQVVITYLITSYLHFPVLCNYFLVIIGTMVLLPIFYEMIFRIPILNRLLLGK